MRIFILLVAVALFSCKQGSKTAAAEFDTKKMQTEVQAVIAQLYDAAAHVDSTRLFDLFSFTDPDFVYVDITGEFYDVTKFQKMVHEFYATLKTEIIKKGTERFVYLDENNVLWSTSTALTANYLDGKQELYEPFGVTILFRKTNDKWKIVLLQESTQAPLVKNQ